MLMLKAPPDVQSFDYTTRGMSSTNDRLGCEWTDERPFCGGSISRSCLDPPANRSQPEASLVPKAPVEAAGLACNAGDMLAAALVEHLLPRHEADGYATVGHGEAPAGKIGDASELPADMVSGSGRHLTAGARDRRSLKTFDKVPSTLARRVSQQDPPLTDFQQSCTTNRERRGAIRRRRRRAHRRG